MKVLLILLATAAIGFAGEFKGWDYVPEEKPVTGAPRLEDELHEAEQRLEYLQRLYKEVRQKFDPNSDYREQPEIFDAKVKVDILKSQLVKEKWQAALREKN